MRYVILRDDDTNALTPGECLEQLYRPFLDRGMPVNLATIPCVSRFAKTGEGEAEGFLPPGSASTSGVVPMTAATELLDYLRENPGYHIVQHGLHHTFREFETRTAAQARHIIEQGGRLLQEAGLGRPQAFVAPHDKFSRRSMLEATRNFRVVSTGWFELGRVPFRWWPAYFLKKIRNAPHWHAGQARLLSHPGCILSHNRAPEAILPAIQKEVRSRELTVLVTHWWEYFPGGNPNLQFLDVLHATAEWLASQPDVRVISFGEAAGELACASTRPESKAASPTAGPDSLARVPELR